MRNPKKTITPNEINKFTYCSFQWYYERLYGKDYLRQAVKKRNDQISATNKRLSNFAKGNKHHANVHKEYKRKLRLFKIAAVLIFVAAICVFIWLQYNGALAAPYF